MTTLDRLTIDGALIVAALATQIVYAWALRC